MIDGVQVTEIREDEWILGDVNAPVTILEYGDFECPYCRAARPVLRHLVDRNEGQVRLIYRHFPITSLHPHAELAAEASEAAGSQDLFWEMHDMIFTHQDALEFDNLVSYAESIGADATRFADELARHVYFDEVRRDFENGIIDGVNGTPTLFINGVRYDGPREYNLMQAVVDSALEQSGARAAD